MATKKKTSSKTSSTSSAPVAGGDSSTASNTAAADNLKQGITDIGTNIGNTVLAPIVGWFGQLEADFMNTLNQILNSLFYGLAVLAGLGLVIAGVVMLFSSTETGKAAITAAALL